MASVCYLVDSLATLLALDFGSAGQALVLLPPAVAELTLCGWLILGRRAKVAAGGSPLLQIR